ARFRRYRLPERNFLERRGERPAADRAAVPRRGAPAARVPGGEIDTTVRPGQLRLVAQPRAGRRAAREGREALFLAGSALALQPAPGVFHLHLDAGEARLPAKRPGGER